MYVCMYEIVHTRNKNEKKTIGKQTTCLIENNCIQISYK